MTNDKPDMLAALARFTSEDSTHAHYDAWADRYEDDLIGRVGYSAHIIGAAALADALPERGASIIDIGCGTGLVGAELARHGFQRIDGLDISEDMMALADAKGCYRNLMAGDVMAGLDMADATYEAAICVGSFAPGHLGPAAFREIIRLVRPGGPIIIFMNAQPYVDDGYQFHVDRLVAEGRWHVDGIDTVNYMAALDRPGKLIRARRA